jgi:hypothetical protein
MPWILELLAIALIVGILAAGGHPLCKLLRSAGKNTIGLASALGFCLFTAWLTFCFYWSIPLWLATLLPVAAMGHAASQGDFWQRWRGHQIPCLLVVYLLFKVAVFRGGPFEFRVHFNADAYGVASAFGRLAQHFSYADLLRDFFEVTGLSEAKWVKPPKLFDVWSIPDSQLRFASDQIVGSGRVGVPALLGSLSLLLPPTPFFRLFMLFGLVGLWCQAAVSFELARSLAGQKLGGVTGAVLLLLLPCTLVSQLFLLEGMAVPIWQQTLLLLLAFVWTRAMLGPPSGWAAPAAVISAIILALYVSYPDSLILLLAVAGTTAALVAMPWCLRRLSFSQEKVYLSAAVFVVPLLCIALDSRLRGQVLSRLMDVNGATTAGGSIHLGLPSYLGLLGAVSRSTVMRFVPTGFLPLSQDPDIAAVTIAASAAILLLGAWLASRRLGWASAVVWIPVLVAAGLPALFLYRVKTGAIVSDYVYFRSLATYIALSVPFLCATVHMGLSRVRLGRFGRFAVLALALVAAGHMLNTSARSFTRASTLAAPGAGCPAVADYRRSIFVSDKPENAAFALTACGPLNYLTDTWEPQMWSDGQQYSVFELQVTTEDMVVRPIGSLRLAADLKGPCNTQCIRAYPTFMPSGGN